MINKAVLVGYTFILLDTIETNRRECTRKAYKSALQRY